MYNSVHIFYPLLTRSKYNYIVGQKAKNLQETQTFVVELDTLLKLHLIMYVLQWVFRAIDPFRNSKNLLLKHYE